MESLLFTDQCVYLSRKHLLWSRKGLFLFFGEAGRQLFPDQRHAEEKGTSFGTGGTFAGPGSAQDVAALLKLGGCGKSEEAWRWFHFKLVVETLSVLSCEHTSSSVKRAPTRRDPHPPTPTPPPTLRL